MFLTNHSSAFWLHDVRVVKNVACLSSLLSLQRRRILTNQNAGKSMVTWKFRLRASDFYEVIVDEGEARINYHLIEIESE